MARKAAASAADCVVFDLEDAVPRARKADARALLAQALEGMDFGDKEVCVRINGVQDAEFEEDLRTVSRLAVHSVVVPKVETADDVRRVDTVLSAVPSAESIALHLAVETPLGLWECREFCRASPRVEAVLFGSGDFTASSGFSDDEAALVFPRSHISLVASSLSIDALDMVYGTVADLTGLEKSARAGRSLGYAGKWVIHPNHVGVVNSVFSASEDEVIRARRVLAAMSDAAEAGRAAVTLDGALIDEATVRWADAVTARARA
jgi:citrate lyase subunit beta/citryl-CoA lyase